MAGATSFLRFAGTVYGVRLLARCNFFLSCEVQINAQQSVPCREHRQGAVLIARDKLTVSWRWPISYGAPAIAFAGSYLCHRERDRNKSNGHACCIAW